MEHKKFKVGRHLKTDRLLYEHHGIYIGEGPVIRYAFDGITVDTVGKLARGEITEEAPHFDSPYTGEEIRKRAFGCLGENRYDLISNNCEHLTNWCCTGGTESEQVGETARLTGALLLKILEEC